MSTYFIAMGAAALIAYFGARFLSPYFLKWGLVDVPHTQARKVHATKIPFTGGATIVCAIACVMLAGAVVVPEMIPLLAPQKWTALIFGASVLFVCGAVDDTFGLPPKFQIIGPLLAASAVVFSGIQVTKITNPFFQGSVISFASIALLAPLITFFWLMMIMYGTKLLDGLDGLATGVSTIAAIMIFCLTQTIKFYEPTVGFFALVCAGACLGFLVHNFYPARAFLGEGGSLFLGFIIGVLAILSGSKIATTLLVMGLPLFDVVRVMIVRRILGQPIFVGDQLHLHYLLMRNGLSHRAAVLVYYVIAASFGVTALLFQSRGKLVMLGILFLSALVLTTVLHVRVKKI